MSSFSTEAARRTVRDSIVKWYKVYGRDFPWRSTNDPYHVLIAEMLLRRTTATAVSRIYPDFMKRFGRPEQLARARTTTIASMISILGLQNVRARHLQHTARCIINEYDGLIPNALEKLVLLPGVGKYVASAVLNFAYQSPVPLVDGNVIHLISRVFGLTFSDPTDQCSWDFMGSFSLGTQNKAFYWGVIDIVAIICLRKTPRCKICPLREVCIWSHKNND